MFIPLTPLRFLHRAMDVFGSKVGVVSGSRQFTYAQFGERVERLATGLTRHGIEAGDRVAYLSFNNNELLEGYYGVVQARAIVMPLNVRLAESELAAILKHSGARMVIFEADFAPVIEAAEGIAARSEALRCDWRENARRRFDIRRAPRPGPAAARGHHVIRRELHRGALLHQRQHRRSQRARRFLIAPSTCTASR